VSDQLLLQRIMILLLEQTIIAYEANSEMQLNVVSTTANQIRIAVNNYRQRMQARALARQAAIIVSMLSLGALAALVILGPRWGLHSNTVLSILDLPLPVLLWSAIGSLTAMLYRFNTSGDIELKDPLRWLFTRPLTGVVMGSITFLVLKAGLLTITSKESTVALGSSELMWLIAFLTGFSDRFADVLLKSLVGKFSGDKDADLVSVEMTATSPSIPSSWGTIVESMEHLVKKRKAPAQEENTLQNHEGIIDEGPGKSESSEHTSAVLEQKKGEQLVEKSDIETIQNGKGDKR
jgi:hypothetical protein